MITQTKNLFSKVNALLLALAVCFTTIPLDAFTVNTAKSYLGEDDTLNEYKSDFVRINSVNDLTQYIYKPNAVNLFTNVSTKKGGGSVSNTSTALRCSLRANGYDNLGDGLIISTTDLNYNNYNLAVINFRQIQGNPVAVDDDLNFRLKFDGHEGAYTTWYDGTVEPDDVNKTIFNIDFNGTGRVQAEMYYTWLVDYSTYISDIYEVYLKRGGIIVNIDPNGGTYEGSTNSSLYFAQQPHGVSQELHKLQTSIPQKAGATFIGWDIVEQAYYGQNGEPNARFDASGRQLFVKYNNRGEYQRIYLTLKARWATNGNSSITIKSPTIGSGSVTKTGKYLDTEDLTPYCAKRNNVYTITFNTNAKNGDIVSVNPTSVQTSQTFHHWDWDYENTQGYITDDALTYVYLGYNGSSSTITAVYVNDSFMLPTPTSSKNLGFAGWYNVPVPYFNSISDMETYKENFVGAGGTWATLSSTQTLYAGWSKLNLTTSHVGWSNDEPNNHGDVWHKNSIDWLNWNTPSMNPNYYFRVYTVETDNLNGNDRWAIKIDTDTPSSEYKKTTPYTTNGSWSAPNTGYVKVTAIGGSGGNAGSSGYRGGNAGYVSSTIYTKYGESFNWIIGNSGTTSSSSAATTIQGGTGYGNGGNATSYMIAHGYSDEEHAHEKGMSISWYGADGKGSRQNGYASPEVCGDSNHTLSNDQADFWRCGRCAVFRNVQDYWKNGGWGTGGCPNAYSASVGTDWGLPDRNRDGYRDACQKTLCFAGSGGGGTAVWFQSRGADKYLIMAAGGGKGASASAHGTAPTSITDNASTWRKDGTTASTSGQGGNGAGNGVNFGLDGGIIERTGYGASSDASKVIISYYDHKTSDNKMKVASADLAKPNAPLQSSGVLKGDTQNPGKIQLTFNKTVDNGTKHFYRVEMYNNSNGLVQTSEPISITATSGVLGYYYTVNTSPTSPVITNHSYSYIPASGGTTETIHNIPVNNYSTQYIHVATVDKAGNISETTVFELPVAYFIHFNSNKGSGSSPVQGTMPDQVVILGMSGQKIDTNQFSRDGYIYQGWRKGTTADTIGTETSSVVVDYVDNAPLTGNEFSVGQTMQLYAVWKPIEYNIYYTKGKTDDTVIRNNSVFGTSTRATDLNASSITQHPYWHSVFDGTDTFAHIGQFGNNPTKVKGTSYEIEFNANFPNSDKVGGAATQECKDSYTLNIIKSSVQREADEQTIDSTNKTAQKLSGYLISNDTWTITKAVGGGNIYAKNGSVAMSTTVPQNDSVYRGNYIIDNDSYCQADADWADINLKLPEPTMYGYHFLGWFTTPDYELKPDGKGNFDYTVSGENIKDTEILGKKNTREEPANTQILTLKPDTTKHTIKLYAHWEPIMAYLNYSYDDGDNTNYTNYGNSTSETFGSVVRKIYDGHLVNNTNNGYLAQNVHTGVTYWNYVGRPEAAAFFCNNLNAYMPYARRNSNQTHAIEPALYFNIRLIPRTNLYLNTKYKTNTTFGNVLDTTTVGDDYSVFMPNKFLDTVYNFQTPRGIRDELIAANEKAVTWEKAPSDNITYNRDTWGKQAEGIGRNDGKYSYNLYDVWSLSDWYYSYAYKDGDKISAHLDTAPDINKGAITDATKTENNSSIYRYDLTAVWKNEDGIKVPKPKRILVFDLDVEGGKFVNNVENNDSTGEPINVNGSDDVRTLDIYSDGEMSKLLDLAQGKEVSWDDTNDILPNVYQGKGNNGNSIITADDAKHSVVYDFNLEGWVNGTTGTTKLTQPLSHISIDRANKQGDTAYYAKWNLDNDLTLPQVEKEGYVFLGWYTVPQNILPIVNVQNQDVLDTTITSTYGDGGLEDKYYAGAGWNVIDGHLESKDCKLQKNTCLLDWDNSNNRLKLYAWFNREPVFVDVYEGLFFEGQDVNLSDLKKLVGVFDFEDDYSEIALQYIESLPEVDMNSLYMPIIVDKDVDLDAHKDYTEAEILNTLQVEDWKFDSDRWEPVTSVDAEYDELPNEDEENSSDKITPTKNKLKIENGKLITPNGTFDGVYKSKENGKIYYTDVAKAELAYWINDPDNPDYAKYTGLKLKVKSITYKVKNKAPANEEVIFNVPISIDDYDEEINKSKTVNERSRYNALGEPVQNGGVFKGRNGDVYTRKISKYRVDTSTSRMIPKQDEKGKWTASGEFDVTYEVTDNGILFNGLIIDNSPITLTYSRGCKIQYNKLPQIAISNLVDFTDTSYTDYNEFANMILDSQIVVDGEDNVSNQPWWSKKKTTPRLVNSLEIVNVKNICMDEVLLEKYGLTPTDSAVVNAQNVGTLKELYNNYKTAPKGTTNWKVWQCISNFGVVVDAHDQWGKYASGRVVPNWHKKSDGGDEEPKVANPDDGEGIVVDETSPDSDMPKQTEDYRTVTFILINPEDDLSLNAANIMETVRFISNVYIDGDFDSLGDTFWGTPEGKQKIREAIQRRQGASGGASYATSYTNELGQQVDIHVEDYTTD